MRLARHVFAVALMLVLVAASASAQESKFAADLRREREHIAENCTAFSKLASCALTIATDYPFHLALGSLAPGNGFGFGIAFVENYTPNEFWKLSWSADGVYAPSGAWRAGAYMRIIHIPDEPITVSTGGTPPSGTIAIREYPVFSIYAQTISLEELFFFGPPGAARESGRSLFRERQTIVGAQAIWPVRTGRWIQALRPSLLGGINARFVRVRGTSADGVPSTADLYDDRTAPGLATQPTFIELHEGVRFKPSTANGWLRFNYLVDFQQFFSEREAALSFHRWTLDLRHELPLYRTVSSQGPRDSNGPNECFTGVSSNACPPVSLSRNRVGSIGVRLLTSSSSGFSDDRVPFYLQPTLGGSDINGQRLLPGFDDYRFRGPHLIALQESIEHSIWGPLGVTFVADQGKVVADRGSLNFNDLDHSFAVGLTVRAGGFPMINFLFAWSTEGHHVIGTMDASLLGGSSRPSLH